MSLRIYGKLPSGKRLQRIKASPNYRHGAFQNLSKTKMMAPDATFFSTLRDFIKKPGNIRPASAIPAVTTNLKSKNPPHPAIIWFGHSSYMIRINDRNILVDPVLSGNAAPLSFMIKAFKGSNLYHASDMPVIDLLVLTHDHYDHLDYRTILKIKNKVSRVLCPLGVGSHLEYWKMDPAIISEVDWWDTYIFEDLHFTAAPARHFSGRGIKRGQSLWCSYILKTANESIYIGGDSGYDEHFKEIGNKYGPFDIALLEAGQYNTSWPQIHMMPEQTVQAAADLGAKILLPLHWGKFALAMHPWTEPVERVLKEAALKGVSVTTPVIGEPVYLNSSYPKKKWWRKI